MSEELITILGISLTLFLTALGSAVVFFFKGSVSKKVNALFLGFASGVMVAASVWSLLIPAIDGAEDYGSFAFLPAVAGIFLGALLLGVLDKICPEKMNDTLMQKRKYNKLFFAITFHNIPEGLAVGVAFGGAIASGGRADFWAAFGLAVGIGVQNIPEGTALSLPMKSVFGSRTKAFLVGSLSAVVEPIFAIVGICLALQLPVLMPWLLAIAAGAMLLVVAQNLLPDAVNDSVRCGSWSFIVGFTLMMVLDVALG